MRAVYVDESIPLNKVPFVTISDYVMLGIEDNSMMFTIIKDVPAGYTLVECGAILLKAEEPFTGELTLDTPGASRASLHDFTNDQFYVRKKDVISGDTWYARAYLIYTDSSNNTVTAYSDNTVSGTL